MVRSFFDGMKWRRFALLLILVILFLVGRTRPDGAQSVFFKMLFPQLMPGAFDAGATPGEAVLL